jgi:Helix-turn-helix domain
MTTHDHLRLVDTDEPAGSRPPPSEVTLLTVPEAAKFLRIGRSAAYELARRFEATGGAEGLPCVRIGDRLLRVPVDALREMVTIRA